MRYEIDYCCFVFAYMADNLVSFQIIMTGSLVNLFHRYFVGLSSIVIVFTGATWPPYLYKIYVFQTDRE